MPIKKARKKSKPPVQTGRSLPPEITRYSSYRAAGEPAEAPAPKKPRHIIRRIVLSLLLLILAAAIFIGVLDARNLSHFSRKMFGTGNVFSLLGSSGLQTADNGRVNVLVAGYSIDDPGHAGSTLTDSIMLLSMNPANNTGYMLSIPRDLYVEIPGYGHAKINEAYKDGGMGLLTQIVQNIFSTQINYYALVDYTAVRSIVDAIGGIDVTINSPDGRLYDPNKDWTTGGPLVDLANGMHHLNGQQALDLTRARGDPSQYGDPVGFEQTDFQRTADQRLVFTAIKSKLNWKFILNPRTNSQILDAIASNVKTDLPASQARPLFGLFNRIPSNKLQSVSLRELNGHNYLASTYYEGSTLTPAAGLDDYSQIDAALDQLNQ